jgi:hypothetical protein
MARGHWIAVSFEGPETSASSGTTQTSWAGLPWLDNLDNPARVSEYHEFGWIHGGKRIATMIHGSYRNGVRSLLTGLVSRDPGVTPQLQIGTPPERIAAALDSCSNKASRKRGSEMNMPGFTAEASVGPTVGIHKQKSNLRRSPSGVDRPALVAAVSANVIVAKPSRVWAAMQSRSVAGTRSLASGGLGFVCGPNSCACAGIDDCLDLVVTTDLCGPSIDCIDLSGVTVCRCTRK